jgi:two-component system chemotaxis response regulator CheB
MSERIRVLIVDDSALTREALKAIITSDPQLELVGEAKDGKEGVEKALALKPQVITMDLKMPVMGGVEAIERIMQEQPIPIIVVSSLDTSVIVKALSIGAMDFVPITQDIEAIAKDLLEKIKIAFRVRPLRRIKVTVCPPKVKTPAKKVSSKNIVVIGISTGGPQALQVLLAKLPADLKAGIVIVQHIAKGFIQGLVEWLKGCSALDIAVAKAGDTVKDGLILFAPDDYNLYIGEGGIISLKEDTTKKMLHVPSIDELMKSAAEIYGENCIGVLMTGMGRDGVEGMRQIKRCGGTTIAQDEKSSVVFGMNKAAIDSGCVEVIASLDEIIPQIIRSISANG